LIESALDRHTGICIIHGSANRRKYGTFNRNFHFAGVVVAPVSRQLREFSFASCLRFHEQMMMMMVVVVVMMMALCVHRHHKIL